MNLCADVFAADNTGAHNFRMDVPQILKALKSHLKVSQAGLAKRLGGGITQPQISRWIRGAEPERANYDRIYTLAHSMGIIVARHMASEDVAAGLTARASARKRCEG